MVGNSPAESGETLDGKTRSVYVRRMFEQITPRYDLMNCLMTAGQDKRWRQTALQEAALPPNGWLLDLATGTGDIALLAIESDPSLHIIGGDFALPMMRIGQRRRGGDGVRWLGTDALRLPFPNESFDAVTSAYLIRNLPPEHLLDGLKEQERVIKSGGRVVCLDATPPPPSLLRPAIRFYLNNIIPLLGGLLTGHREAYSYLPRSAQAFKTGAELATLMKHAGLVNVHQREFMFGTMTLLVGEKP